MRVVTAGDGYASQYSRVAHFGLEKAEVLDELSVTWPSGIQQSFQNVETNRLVDLIESDGQIHTVDLAQSR
jgi:hypothetical protein